MDGLSVVASPPTILDHLSALADQTRARLLFLLERHELTVSELCVVLQLPQSTVSRHLKALAEASWVASRSEATSNLYRMTRDDLEPGAQRLWSLVREQLTSSAASMQDQHRLQEVLHERRTKSQEFFSSSAGQWDRLRAELFGPRFHLSALLGLVDPTWVVGDIGCGTGEVSAALAPFVDRVVAVDGSGAMLQAARRRLKHATNVDVRRGEIEALPIDDASLDAVTFILVLHHVAAPEKALAEVARILRPGGRLLVVDMRPHDRERYRQQMGHVWLGFSEPQLLGYLESAGFLDRRVQTLPSDPRAKGPALFAATARRGGRSLESTH
jgi:ArsR family transcriptional regulator